MATTASALGASRSIQSQVGIGCPVFYVGPERGPVSLFLDLLVGNRSLDDQDEGIEPPLLRLVPEPHELIANFIGKNRIMQMNLG